MWRNHPRALPYLFLSEMWERFGYYLMIGIFTLYLKDVKDGFAMSEKDAANLYGTFIALVFLTPFLGGLIADRFMGYKWSVILGGLLMASGYMLMGIHSEKVLYLAMTLVIFGNGFFKPNISTLLGSFYSADPYRELKDEGYNIFYMGINIGAFICNFFGAALQIFLGWQWAFFAAGAGMLIGVLVFLAGTRHFEGHTAPKGTQPGDMSFLSIVGLILLPCVIFGVIGWFINGVAGPDNPKSYLFESDSTDAFIFACIPVLFFYGNLFRRAREDEKPQIGALLSIFSVVILFWAVFKLNGSALNTWADRYTDRQVTGTMESLCNDLRLSRKLVYARDSVALYDAQFRLQKENGVVITTWDYPVYFRNVKPETLPSEGSTISVWAPNLSQSINPGWVILLTPLVVAFFTWLKRGGREPGTPTKIAFGLLVSGLSVLVMVGAVHAGSNGMEKVSVMWLVANYGVITIGELFLSPMGLSLVSKLSPPSITSLMMGGWFLSTSIGNKLSGVLAGMWDSYPEKADFFWVNFLLLMGASLLMFSVLRPLNRVMAGKGIR